MTQSQRAELREVFLYTRDELGIDAAIEAVIRQSRAMRIGVVPSEPIVDMACKLFGLTRLQFAGPSRHAELCDCRASAAWAMRSFGMPYSAIARKIGRGNHTTVIASLARCKARSGLVEKANEILEKLAGSPVLESKEQAA